MNDTFDILIYTLLAICVTVSVTVLGALLVTI